MMNSSNIKRVSFSKIHNPQLQYFAHPSTLSPCYQPRWVSLDSCQVLSQSQHSFLVPAGFRSSCPDGLAALDLGVLMFSSGADMATSAKTEGRLECFSESWMVLPCPLTAMARVFLEQANSALFATWGLLLGKHHSDLLHRMV